MGQQRHPTGPQLLLPKDIKGEIDQREKITQIIQTIETVIPERVV